MPLLMIEPVVDALKAALSANLPAKIAALQPTFVPVLPMAAPAEYVFGEKANFLLGYPVVQLVQLDTVIANDELRWQDHRHRIEIGIFVLDPIEENLARLLDRYARCLVETLHEQRKAGAFYPAFDLHFDGETITYSSTFPQAGEFIRALFLTVRTERRDVERG